MSGPASPHHQRLIPLLLAGEWKLSPRLRDVLIVSTLLAISLDVPSLHKATGIFFGRLNQIINQFIISEPFSDFLPSHSAVKRVRGRIRDGKIYILMLDCGWPNVVRLVVEK
jgi:hypothetical protein